MNGCAFVTSIAENTKLAHDFTSSSYDCERKCELKPTALRTLQSDFV